MKLHEILKKTNITDVISEIIRLYKDQSKNEEGYRKVYKNLLEMTPGTSEPGIQIELSLISDEGESWPLTHGVEKDSGVSYGLELCPWADLLDTEVSSETVLKFKPETIVAGCLYEMTFFGFTEDKIHETEKRWSKDT